MKPKDAEHLEHLAVQCDRAIVRLTTKATNQQDLADIGYVTGILANARDGLRWAAKR
jgi:hypothetical protein